MTHFLNDSPPGEASYKYTNSGKTKGVIYIMQSLKDINSIYRFGMTK